MQKPREREGGKGFYVQTGRGRDQYGGETLVTSVQRGGVDLPIGWKGTKALLGSIRTLICLVILASVGRNSHKVQIFAFLIDF